MTTKRRTVDLTPGQAAYFSPDRTYRYWLEREVEPAGMLPESASGTVAFVMLNPSTADERNDDPTIRRCLGYAKRWRYARLIVVNAYALRSTDPRALKSHADPVGPENDDYLWTAATVADRVVVAWGVHVGARGPEVLRLLQAADADPLALGLTKNGTPRHPLYLRADAQLFSVAA